MRSLSIIILICAVFTAQPSKQAMASELEAGNVAHKEIEARKKVAKSLAGVAELKDEASVRDVLLTSAAQMPEKSYLREKLKQIADHLSEEQTVKATLESAKQQVASIAGDLAFEPTLEAGFPEGFPGPTAVGEIEMKSYPTYRMVQTNLSGKPKWKKAAPAFFTLFNHIKSNDIAMTAPVEMTYDVEGSKIEKSAMAFLYKNQEIGELGETGKIKVLDVEPMKVVAIGLRGETTDKRIADAHQELKSWTEKHLASQYALKETVRVMGYNGPSVKKADRFFEVQIELNQAPGKSVE